jgi:hypothetical protein
MPIHKQRHTAKRVWQRLRDEHGFTGGYSTVRDDVRRTKTRRREVFVPLAHPPGHAQIDFGEAVEIIGGQRLKLAKCSAATWTPALTSRVFGFRDSLIPSLIWRRDDGATVAVRFVGTFGAEAAAKGKNAQFRTVHHAQSC